jgi:hypothetical protein
VSGCVSFNRFPVNWCVSGADLNVVHPDKNAVTPEIFAIEVNP